MPSSRRRRRRSVVRRRWGRAAAVLLIGGLLAVVLVGSLVEINAQSASYRRETDTAYGQLAAVVVADSNQTGSELATLMASAARLPSGPVAPNRPGIQPLAAGAAETARSRLQERLDRAVSDAASDAERASALVPPYPTGGVSPRFTGVMRQRAAGTTRLRTIIDGLLGMAPLPVAGAPTTAPAKSSAVRLTAAQAAPQMAEVGQELYNADAAYRQLLSSIHVQRIPIGLPASAWVTLPAATAALGPPSLGATAFALAGSAGLALVHQMVITAVGLTPPAVITGAPGMVNTDCQNPVSNGAAALPTVLPPATTVQVAATVTNCGTVTETGVTISQTLTLADPAGTAPPPAAARGGRFQTKVTLRSGSSVALGLPRVTVAAGHRYDLVLTIAVPAGQANPAGSTQAFLIQIAS